MVQIIKVKDEIEVIAKLCCCIEEIANNSIANNNIFRIGLSGGSLTKYLPSGLQNISSDWSKWELYFCDERYVPETDADSTFGIYKANLLPTTELKESQFVQINISLELENCAEDYENKIRKSFGMMDTNDIPVFDLLLLGMGPDGHTCSLFPGHKLLTETSKLIAPIDDSPKPPPQRVTMTYPLLNNAKNLIFAMSGAGKADMVKRILVNKEQLPAAMVSPTHGKLIWIVDGGAGSHL